MSLLQVRGLQAGYAGSQVLFGIDFEVDNGEVLTLLGRNGMGKTTTVKCLSGLLKPAGGTIEFNGQQVQRSPAYRIGRAGLGLVPEGRQVFPTLTVRENLIATASTRNAGARPWTLERVFELFPRLRERTSQPAGKMSGGEQQMLAIGRALMTNPKLLILDEATEGLAPLVRQEIWNCLAQLKQEGLAMIVVDKHLKALLPLANRHVIIEKGRVAWSGSGAELTGQPELVHRYLGV
ncbi:MAG: ABC transporter ATP-binding protein [Burkholderiales bacterium]|nr:ABC transporter ATP-binding protein [Burkholderiales bacterium]ODU69248.1 MAG: ABC transporter ATP-binding protein [Lautropia sp. SCN 66-9]